MQSVKYVYSFGELDAAVDHVGGDWDGVRRLLGGKGANLADMTRLGIPVPPGFIVTTEACNSYLASYENGERGEFSPQIWSQIREALCGVEETTGRRFGDEAVSQRPPDTLTLEAGVDKHPLDGNHSSSKILRQ